MVLQQLVSYAVQAIQCCETLDTNEIRKSPTNGCKQIDGWLQNSRNCHCLQRELREILPSADEIRKVRRCGYIDTGEVKTGIPFSRYALNRLAGWTFHLTSHFVQTTSIERLAHGHTQSGF